MIIAGERGINRRYLYAGFALIALMLSGCALPFQKGPVFDDVNLGGFPIERTELLVVAYKNYKPYGPAKSVVRSLIASQNVLIRDPDNELANYYGAKSALWLMEFGAENIEKGKLLEQGNTWAERLLTMDPDNAEYHFLAGALLGFKIKDSIRPSLIRLRTVHERFEKAAEMDLALDDGGPLRALGMVLLKSPPWPTGVGDLDEAIEVLEKAAVMFPFHPANHLYVAQAYMEDDRWKDAEAALARSLELTKGRKYGEPGAIWRAEAKTHMKKVMKELKESEEKE